VCVSVNSRPVCTQQPFYPSLPKIQQHWPGKLQHTCTVVAVNLVVVVVTACAGVATLLPCSVWLNLPQFVNGIIHEPCICVQSCVSRQNTRCSVLERPLHSRRQKNLECCVGCAVLVLRSIMDQSYYDRSFGHCDPSKRNCYMHVVAWCVYQNML
jgi:hypothetical protein